MIIVPYLLIIITAILATWPLKTISPGSKKTKGIEIKVWPAKGKLVLIWSFALLSIVVFYTDQKNKKTASGTLATNFSNVSANFNDSRDSISILKKYIVKIAEDNSKWRDNLFSKLGLIGLDVNKKPDGNFSIVNKYYRINKVENKGININNVAFYDVGTGIYIEKK